MILDSLTPSELELLNADWWWWGRPEQQLPEGTAWRTWVILAGRGWGKTRTGAEAVRTWSRDVPRIHLIGRTPADVRDVMVEGVSGIMAITPKWERPTYQPSRTRLVWPNGSLTYTYSAQEPDQLRGPQCHKLWGDEVAAWPTPLAWDMAMLGLRLGDAPQAVVTTTPKPKALVRRLVNDPRNVVTKGSTYDNAANLAQAFLDDIVAAYAGTALGRQELDADILDEAPGALWKRALFDQARIRPLDGQGDLGKSALPHLGRIVVAIDPAVSNVEGSDETGIVAFGATAAPWQTRHGYVLGDASGRYTPEGWAQAALNLADLVGADEIVAEANNGGDLVRSNLRAVSSRAKVTLVHASRGKRARAEPIAALYEQGRIHHLGTFEALEDQCCTWVPGETAESPDRIDALTWAASHTMLGTNRTMVTT